MSIHMSWYHHGFCRPSVETVDSIHPRPGRWGWCRRMYASILPLLRIRIRQITMQYKYKPFTRPANLHTYLALLIIHPHSLFSAKTGGNASCFDNRRSSALSNLAPIARVDISSTFFWLGTNRCLSRVGTSIRPNPAANLSSNAFLSTLATVESDPVEHILSGRTPVLAAYSQQLFAKESYSINEFVGGFSRKSHGNLFVSLCVWKVVGRGRVAYKGKHLRLLWPDDKNQKNPYWRHGPLIPLWGRPLGKWTRGLTAHITLHCLVSDFTGQRK